MLRPVPRLAALAVPALAAVALAASPASAQLSILWSQPVDAYSTTSSTTYPSAFPVDLEAADDFDVEGIVRRIVVAGNKCASCTDTLDVEGVRVRFYTVEGGQPGALLSDEFLPTGTQGLVMDPTYPTTLDVTLGQPFFATGEHFVSVQLIAGEPHLWSWWSAGPQVKGHPLQQRSHGGPWLTSEDDPNLAHRDLAFQLWGDGPPPPTEPELLYSQSQYIFSDGTPSGVWPGNDFEAADDFELDAQITRVRLATKVEYQQPYPEIAGVRLRFYDAAGDLPGALLYDETVPVGPQIVEDGSTVLYVELGTPLPVSGRTFVSAQLLADNDNGWVWWHGKPGDFDFAPAVVRSGSGTWSAIQEEDEGVNLGLGVYGIDTSPPIPLLPDPCGDWQELPLPHPADVDKWIARDLEVVAADDVWLVGPISFENSSGGVFSLNYDGSAWSFVDTPNPEPYPGAGGVSLETIEAVAPDDVWAAGGQQLIDTAGFVGLQPLVMRWDGSSWDVVPTPTTGAGSGGAIVRDIEIVAPDDIWFVGDWVEPYGCDMSLAMRWDGSDFTVYETPCDDIEWNNNGFGLEAVSATGPDDVWAVGAGGDGDSSIHSHVIHFDGSSWEYVPAPAPGIVHRLYAVQAIAPDDVWATGQYLDATGYHSFAIHWDGSGWTLYDGADFPTGGGALHAFASDDVYTGGGGISHWDGTAWSWVEDFGQLTGEHAGISVTALEPAGECELWAAGREVIAGEILAFAARQVTDKFWAAVTLLPCDGAASTPTLELGSPPAVGGTVAVEIDDPLGATGLDSGLTLWALSLGPPADAECGDPVEGLGAGGTAGSLFLDPAALFLLHGPRAWSGPGQPTQHALPVPNVPTLAGVDVWTQGVIVDGASSVLTHGLALQIGA